MCFNIYVLILETRDPQLLRISLKKLYYIHILGTQGVDKL